MRTKILALGTAAVLALALPATTSAQIPGIDIGLAGGPSFPLGDFADEADTGFHLRGSFGLEVPLVPLGVRADLLWQRFPYEDDAVTTLGGLLNATWRLGLPVVRPYLIGGAGFMRHTEPGEGEPATEFAWAAGAGIGLRLLGFGAFVEARYLDWGHQAVPLTIGVTF